MRRERACIVAHLCASNPNAIKCIFTLEGFAAQSKDGPRWLDRLISVEPLHPCLNKDI